MVEIAQKRNTIIREWRNGNKSKKPVREE